MEIKVEGGRRWAKIQIAPSPSLPPPSSPSHRGVRNPNRGGQGGRNYNAERGGGKTQIVLGQGGLRRGERGREGGRWSPASALASASNLVGWGARGRPGRGDRERGDPDENWIGNDVVEGMGDYELDTTARSSLDLDFANTDRPGGEGLEWQCTGREEIGQR
ncbi:hypothetical protein TIFTF001_051545 [Ficus carica]|uniref:Uncharacterized protein n=1 Tax=Ficus carica TaxID=3494 RepID=A0AA88CM30_FICCA|nr:hypothetical protein TIFTF001_051545 [Ficus carica]